VILVWRAKQRLACLDQNLAGPCKGLFLEELDTVKQFRGRYTQQYCAAGRHVGDCRQFTSMLPYMVQIRKFPNDIFLEKYLGKGQGFEFSGYCTHSAGFFFEGASLNDPSRCMVV